VLGVDNLLRALQIGLLLLVPAAVGARLVGARPGRFAAGFAVLYALGCLSQVLAGAPASAALGLEYVLYALVIGLLLGHTTPLRALLQCRTGRFVLLGNPPLADQLIKGWHESLLSLAPASQPEIRSAQGPRLKKT